MIGRVMIVDDDPVIRRALSSLLARGGFDVCIATDGSAALRLAEIAPPDVVIVDYNMPSGGLFVLDKLRTRLREAVYLAVLTGDDDVEVRQACLTAGADCVLAKPVSPAELLRTLTAALESLRTAS